MDIPGFKYADEDYERAAAPMELDLLAFFSLAQEAVADKIAEAAEKGWGPDQLLVEIDMLFDGTGDRIEFQNALVEKNRRLAGRTEFQGLPISLEHRKGGVRQGTDPDGKEWRTKMLFPYGYIRGTEGTDGDEVDCYIGPDKESPVAYVVHTYKPGTLEYDEDKVMLGFSSIIEARRWLEAHYDRYIVQGIDEIPIEELKQMLDEAPGARLEANVEVTKGKAAPAGTISHWPSTGHDMKKLENGDWQDTVTGQISMSDSNMKKLKAANPNASPKQIEAMAKDPANEPVLASPEQLKVQHLTPIPEGGKWTSAQLIGLSPGQLDKLKDQLKAKGMPSSTIEKLGSEQFAEALNAKEEPTDEEGTGLEPPVGNLWTADLWNKQSASAKLDYIETLAQKNGIPMDEAKDIDAENIDAEDMANALNAAQAIPQGQIGETPAQAPADAQAVQPAPTKSKYGAAVKFAIPKWTGAEIYDMTPNQKAKLKADLLEISGLKESDLPEHGTAGLAKLCNEHHLPKAGLGNTTKVEAPPEAKAPGYPKPSASQPLSEIMGSATKPHVGLPAIKSSKGFSSGSSGAQKITYTDHDGKEHEGVLKRGQSPAHVREEFTANKMYEAAGIGTHFSTMYDDNGKPTMISDYIPNAKKFTELSKADQAEFKKQAYAGFALDAVTANWDVVGPEWDNMIFDTDKKQVIRIDNGGALRYRGQGADKGSAFGEKVGELESMRDPAKAAGKLFSGMTDADMTASISNLLLKKQAILNAIEDPALKKIVAKRIENVASWKPAAKAKAEATVAAADWVAKNKASDWKSPPKPEKKHAEAIQAYQDGHYQSINNALRNYEKLDGTVGTYVKNLDEYFAALAPRPLDVVRGVGAGMMKKIFTGLGFPNFEVSDGTDPTKAKIAGMSVADFLKKHLPGTSFFDQGYVSTSSNKNSDWTHESSTISADKGVGARMLITGNVRGLEMNNTPGYSSIHSGEEEVMLPRGTKFTIKDVTIKNKGGYYLELHVEASEAGVV